MAVESGRVESARQGSGIVALAFLFLVTGWFVGLHLVGSGGEDDAVDVGPSCTSQTVKAGGELRSSLVTVDVFNGSDRSGLANTVSSALHNRGFRQGVIANNTSQVKPYGVTIVTDQQDDPQVQLVAQQFDKVDFATPDFGSSTGSAVQVLVGDQYKALKTAAKNSIKATKEVTVCY